MFLRSLQLLSMPIYRNMLQIALSCQLTEKPRIPRFEFVCYLAQALCSSKIWLSNKGKKQSWLSALMFLFLYLKNKKHFFSCFNLLCEMYLLAVGKANGELQFV